VEQTQNNHQEKYLENENNDLCEKTSSSSSQNYIKAVKEPRHDSEMTN
jgi:hypothetical protein